MTSASQGLRSSGSPHPPGLRSWFSISENSVTLLSVSWYTCRQSMSFAVQVTEAILQSSLPGEDLCTTLSIPAVGPFVRFAHAVTVYASSEKLLGACHFWVPFCCLGPNNEIGASQSYSRLRIRRVLVVHTKGELLINLVYSVKPLNFSIKTA